MLMDTVVGEKREAHGITIMSGVVRVGGNPGGLVLGGENPPPPPVITQSPGGGIYHLGADITH